MCAFMHPAVGYKEMSESRHAYDFVLKTAFDKEKKAQRIQAMLDEVEESDPDINKVGYDKKLKHQAKEAELAKLLNEQNLLTRELEQEQSMIDQGFSDGPLSLVTKKKYWEVTQKIEYYMPAQHLARAQKKLDEAVKAVAVDKADIAGGYKLGPPDKKLQDRVTRLKALVAQLELKVKA